MRPVGVLVASRLPDRFGSGRIARRGCGLRSSPRITHGNSPYGQDGDLMVGVQVHAIRMVCPPSGTPAQTLASIRRVIGACQSLFSPSSWRVVGQTGLMVPRWLKMG